MLVSWSRSLEAARQMPSLNNARNIDSIFGCIEITFLHSFLCILNFILAIEAANVPWWRWSNKLFCHAASANLLWPLSLALPISLSPTLSHDERCSAGSARRQVSTRRRLRDSDSQQAERRRRRRRRLNTRRRRRRRQHTNPPTDQPAKQPNHQPEAQTCHRHAGPTRPSPFCCLHKSSTTTWGRQTKSRLLASCFLLFDTKHQDQTRLTLSHQHVPFLFFFYFFYAYPQWCTEIPTILGNLSSF